MYEAKDYETQIWWSNEDDVFVAQITELPGIMAHGNTRTEAFENIQTALEWMHERGDGLPAPIHLQVAA